MPGDDRDALKRTIPLDPVAAQSLAADTAPAGGEDPRLPGGGLGGFLRAHGCAGADRRYELRQLIGLGATSRVFSAFDHDLGRSVAVKVLEPRSGSRAEDIRSFVAEARVTASLAHPGVLPVHELGVAEDGRPYFSMPPVSGRTLGAAIAASAPGARDARIASFNAIVTIFLQVGHALQFAHDQGYVHQDVKPDNIMLGAYGEVLLLDWGSAARLRPDGERDPLYGTPLYMSPEQARRERTDARSDVYCVGATLFHALMLREPTWDDDPDQFWRLKRSGSVRLPNPAERAGCPTALIAIALKALSPDPGGRYQTMAALCEDLERFQEGQAVTAYREQLPAAIARVYRRNRPLAWTGAFAALLVAASLAWLWIEKSKASADWQLVYDASFADPAARRDWVGRWKLGPDQWRATDTIPDGRLWRIEGDRLIAACGTGMADIAYRRSFAGDLRVEWDYTPLVRTGDLNCFIGASRRDLGYTWHVGGWGNPRFLRLTRGSGYETCDERIDLPAIAVGSTHRFAMERRGPNLRLEIDGALVSSYDGADDVGAADGLTFGFDCCYNQSLAIANVRVWHRPPAQRISPLAVGDKLLARGDAQGARRHFDELANSYSGSDLGIAARIKQGISAVRAGDEDDGLAILEAVHRERPDHPLMPQALVERLRLALRAREPRRAEALIDMLAKHRGDPVLRAALFELCEHERRMLDRDFAVGIDRPIPANDARAAVASALARVRACAQRFGIDTPMTIFESTCIGILDSNGRHADVVDLFPHHEVGVAFSLLYLGRYQEVVDRRSSVRQVVGEALLAMGRDEEVLAGPYDQHHRARAALALQRPLAAASPAASLVPHDSESEQAMALLASERYEDVIARYPDAWHAAEAKFRLGRYEEVLRDHPDMVSLAYGIALERLRARDLAGADKLLARLSESNLSMHSTEGVVLRCFLPVLLDLQRDRRDEARTRLRAMLREHRWVWGQRIWHLAAFALGDIDEAGFRAQPYRRDQELWLDLARGLRADVAGTLAAAATAYRTTLRRPHAEDLLLGGYQLIDWRLSTLRD